MEPLSETNWLVVGLGNPGERYAKTRHNLGFMTVDRLAADEQTQVRREECRSLVGRTRIGHEIVEIAKPQTFMNLCGEAVSCLLRKPDRGVGKLIVISDDLALPFGKIRIRPRGTHGGQNGLRNIIDRLGTQEFTRLRIGIMPEHQLQNAKDYVLQSFSKSEAEKVGEILKNSAEAVRDIVLDGVEKAMAKWN